MCDFVRERETEAVSLEISLTLFRAGTFRGANQWTSTSHTERDDDQQPKTKVVLKKTECKYLKKKVFMKLKFTQCTKILLCTIPQFPLLQKERK